MIFTTKLRKKQINMQLYHQKKAGTVDNNLEEIQAHIGILIYMGLVDLPEIEDYFQGVCVCPIVRQAMTKKRLKKLGKYLHLNDEEEIPDQQSAECIKQDQL